VVPVTLLGALAMAGALAAFSATGGSIPIASDAAAASSDAGADRPGSPDATAGAVDAGTTGAGTPATLAGPDARGPVAGEVTDGTTGDPATVAGATVGGDRGDADAVRIDRPRPIARIEGLTLLAPSSAVVVVGFHEAATVHALPLTPRGTLTDNHNPTRYEPHPAGVDGGEAVDGVDHLVMASRGRRPGPTSAVDVVLRDDEPVLSPVTGTVSDVRVYYLSGRHEDVRVEIVPDAAPHLRVVLVHVDGIRVGIGDRVTAGVTVLADTARGFPFASQIDRETEPDRWPHVHLEVQPVDAPRPGDDLDDEDDEDAGDDGDAGDSGDDGDDGGGASGRRDADRGGTGAEAAAG
jgi:hypothetical protein